MIIDITQNPNIDNDSLTNPKSLLRKFGRPDDSVEIHVYDLDGNLLISRDNFTSYSPPNNIDDKDGLFNEINIDYTQTLRNIGFSSGQYILTVNLLRKSVINNFDKPFIIEEISASRRELKITSPTISDDNLSNIITKLIYEINNSVFFKEYVMNFGNNVFGTCINFLIDRASEPTEVLVKLFEPLPNDIRVGSSFNIVERFIDSINVNIDLGEPDINELVEGESLRGPNLRIDTRLNSSKPSSFRTYDQILNSPISSSFENISNYLSSSIELAIDFNDNDTDSGYNFENFIHFSSAVERLKNFQYKVQLLESYNNELNEINTLEGSQTSSVVVIAEKDSINNKRKKLIGSFDHYERFLYYESSSRTWPKSNSTRPYTLEDSTSENALTWIGSEDYSNAYYGGELLNASEYDDYNIHKLTNTLPEHIVSNPNNDQYVLFVNMIAEHFDKIWLYIDHITNINQADSKLTRGISKDLVYNVLENAGLKVFDQFENENLFSYITAEAGADGVFEYQAPVSQSMVRASSAGSIPKGDITKELWKRLHDNLPYLLKTKGTERGMKALMSCYGIPETILHVKEYGGPNVDKTEFRTFKYPKFSYELGINTLGVDSSSLDEGERRFGFKLKNIGSALPDVNFNSTGASLNLRIRPEKQDNNYPIIMGPTDTSGYQAPPVDYNSGGIMFLVNIEPSSSADVLGYEKYGRVNLNRKNASGTQTIMASTPYFPIYDGDIWNLEVDLNLPSDNTEIRCYKVSDSNAVFYTASLDLTQFTTNAVDRALLGTLDTNLYIGGLLDARSGYSGFNFPYTGSIQHFVGFKQYDEDTNYAQYASYTPFLQGDAINSGSAINDQFLYLPLGSNLRRPTFTSGSFTLNQAINNNNFDPTDFQSNLDRFEIGIPNDIFGNVGYNWIPFTEDHHLLSPDTVGKSTVSDKVRLDTGTIKDNILSPFIRSEESTQDRQPNDFSDLGVFFSPTFEVNEDIVYKIGPFRMDDYIGDPRHYTSDSYPDLEQLNNIYFDSKIVKSRLNIFDYLKLIQQFDHTLFKMIEQFAPAKANLKTGLVIEPHYLERHKIKGTDITVDPTSYNMTIEGNLPPVSSEYLLHETDININEYIIEGSGGALENNAIFGKKSNQYYTRIKLYNQIQDDTTPPIDNDGTVPPQIPRGGFN